MATRYKMRRTALHLEPLEERSLLSVAEFSAILTEGHVDVFEAAYPGGAWELGSHDEESDTELEPGEALFVVGTDARTARLPGETFDFLGVAAGQDVWILPQNQDPDLIFAGASAEEVEPGTFASYMENDPRIFAEGAFLKFSLRGVRGPGDFSVWSTTGFGEQVPWMTSADGIGTADALFLIEGGHTDYNFGFTARGRYEIDIQASAFLPGSLAPTSSPIVTYVFSVEQPGCLEFSEAVYREDESGGSIVITVHRVGGADGEVAVEYDADGGTAIEGTDYANTVGTLTFADGETTRTFQINVVNDTLFEGTETINLMLENPSNGVILGSISFATVRLRDNDGTSNQRFVSDIYLDLLDRAADATGLGIWTNLLNVGLPRQVVIQAIQSSREYLSNVVQELYARILIRDADPAGLNLFVSYLQAGVPVRVVQSILYSSQEYLDSHGGDIAGFLDGLYQSALGRGLDEGGGEFFSSYLQRGGSRYLVASAILDSDEWRASRVNTWYFDFLNREADAAGRNLFVGALRAGLPDALIIAILLSSNEYFDGV